MTAYVFDDLHRLTERDYTTNGGSPTYPATQGPDTFTYDRAGRMLSATRAYGSGNASVEVDIASDAVGRVTEWSTDGHAIDYAYTVDSSTNRTEVTYPGGRVLRYTMDKRDRATAIANRVSGADSPLLATNYYDLANRLTERDFGNAAWGIWQYDAAGRTSSVIHYEPDIEIGPGGDGPSGGGGPDDPQPTSSIIIAGANYERDNVGNPVVREDAQTASHSEVYWYDAADRLTDFKRGTLNTGHTDIATYTGDANLKQRQTWTLNDLGDWNTNGVRVAQSRLNDRDVLGIGAPPRGFGASERRNASGL